MISLTTPISELSRIGKTTAPKLKKIGVLTAADLLWYLPSRYEDLSLLTKIGAIDNQDKITVKGKIALLKSWRSFKRKMIITEMQIEDDSGSLKAIWFRQPYVAKVLKKGDEVYLSGKTKEVLGQIQLINPSYEKVKIEQIHTARIVPIYPLTEGLTSKQIRFLISQILNLAQYLTEDIPPEILKQEQLANLAESLQQIHFPDDWKKLAEAEKRIKFEELLWLQIKIMASKKAYLEHTANLIATDEKKLALFYNSLPWQLTNDQLTAISETLNDLNQTKPMNRLLEGDVGSGKTVVAAAAADQVVEQNRQVALMAPTEILATQHFKNFCNYLASSKVALLTAKQKMISRGQTVEEISKTAVIKGLKIGEIDMVIGTQSLIQDDVRFKNLGLAIIDEQHRFGVSQRKNLINQNISGLAPHLLSMTATPIPRTLTLTLYGDLDLSIIKEKPADRKTIITKIVDQQNRDKAYDWILQRLKSGEQLFVICPLVEESDKLSSSAGQVKSVMTEYQRLQQDIYPQLKVGFVHGKLKSEAKNAIINDFRNKKFPVLVASSVVEVGIDIPGATMMLIEGAERFGLAQLHQLRGRIGRNDQQAFCFLFTSKADKNNLQRLQALTKYSDGFVLAEIDLELRGAGDVFGTKQSGLLDLKAAKLTDSVLIKKARDWAEKIISEAKWSDYPLLQAKIKSLQEEIHWE